MAKKTSKKRKKSVRRKQTARKPSTESGPVTLKQALAILDKKDAKKPKRRRAAKAGAARKKATSKPITPEIVGEARKELDKGYRREIKSRTKQYDALMKIMMKRGVKGLPAAPKKATRKSDRPSRRRGLFSPKPAGRPLQVFAEGDSWFDYPAFVFKGGLVPRLQKRLGVPILNLSNAGDEVRNMLGVEERLVLIDKLEKGGPAGPWDLLLFSGGGNDIVGNPMALWIKDFKSGVAPEKLIDQNRFQSVLTIVRAGYIDLIGLRDQLSPNTHLMVHAYDFAIPDGRGICHLGPWLKPTFDLKNFPNRNSAFEVVKAMLKQFAAELKKLEKKTDNFTFVNCQGTLSPRTSSWHNELHPSSKGFDKVAVKFHAKIKKLFPGNVL